MALMIVAHPDDEIIFGGAWLLEHPGTIVVSVTNGTDAVRSKEFQKALVAIKCIPVIWNCLDSKNILLPEAHIKSQLSPMIEFHKDIITHNKHGEYGHPQHKQLHDIVASMTSNFWVFSKSPINRLPDKVITRKNQLLRYHKSQAKQFAYLSSYIEYEEIIRVEDFK